MICGRFGETPLRGLGRGSKPPPGIHHRGTEGTEMILPTGAFGEHLPLQRGLPGAARANQRHQGCHRQARDEGTIYFVEIADSSKVDRFAGVSSAKRHNSLARMCGSPGNNQTAIPPLCHQGFTTEAQRHREKLKAIDDLPGVYGETPLRGFREGDYFGVANHCQGFTTEATEGTEANYAGRFGETPYLRNLGSGSFSPIPGIRHRTHRGTEG